VSTARQIDEVYVKTGKVRIISKNFPVHGEQAAKMAEAALCASDQGKFWEYHDGLLESLYVGNVGTLGLPGLKDRASALQLNAADFGSCLDSGKYTQRVQSESDEAQKLGVNGTPAFFINGAKVDGAQPFAVFKAAIDNALAK
jgi:protein-disulfide isomerase